MQSTARPRKSNQRTTWTDEDTHAVLREIKDKEPVESWTDQDTEALLKEFAVPPGR